METPGFVVANRGLLALNFGRELSHRQPRPLTDVSQEFVQPSDSHHAPNARKITITTTIIDIMTDVGRILCRRKA